MAATTNQTLAALQQAGEDFEWYPTTDEILRTVANNIRQGTGRHHGNHTSILDIGAGDGRALTRLQEMLVDAEESYNTVHLEQFAIEKSLFHLSNMPKNIIVIGTEFHEQTLVDKEVNTIFCNPPYSEYEDWTYRILRECAAGTVYLVIPRRWQESARLEQLQEELDIEAVGLGEFDFEGADRRARAKVEIVRFDMCQKKHDAFDRAIEDMLPELDKFDCELDHDEPETRPWDKEIAAGGGIIDSLVYAYQAEQTELYETYREVVRLNPTLLKELGVEKPNILAGLRSKITGLKNKYWEVLFENLAEITKKFATKQRKAFLDSLKDKTVIDFTDGNIRSMLIWISKWSSDFFEEQLLELFRSLAQHCNVHNYKSNEKVFSKDHWRYMRETDTHYKVDYRLVVSGFGGINTSQYSWDAHNGLTNRAHEFLADFITIANNLGYSCSDRSYDYVWRSNKKVELWLDDTSILMDVRAFKNGNLHIRVSKKLMLAINVQVGKLLGWVMSAEEAVRELDPDPEDIEYVTEVFNLSQRIESSNLLRLEQVA